MSFGNPRNNYLLYPAWVQYKTGIPRYLDSSFGQVGNASRYGTFFAGSGTVTRDTNHTHGQGLATDGASKMVTGAVSGNQTETKISMLKTFNGKIGFECKFGAAFAFGSSAFDFGIENRNDTPHAIQARIRFLKSSNELLYEDNTGTFQHFSNLGSGFSNIIVQPPNADSSQSSGDVFFCFRLTIDPSTNTYYSLEYNGKTGYQILFFPAGTAMFDAGNLGNGNSYLFFTILATGGSGAETGYTTDWCVTENP